MLLRTVRECAYWIYSKRQKRTFVTRELYSRNNKCVRHCGSNTLFEILSHLVIHAVPFRYIHTYTHTHTHAQRYTNKYTHTLTFQYTSRHVSSISLNACHFCNNLNSFGFAVSELSKDFSVLFDRFFFFFRFFLLFSCTCTRFPLLKYILSLCCVRLSLYCVYEYAKVCF